MANATQVRIPLNLSIEICQFDLVFILRHRILAKHAKKKILAHTFKSQ